MKLKSHSASKKRVKVSGTGKMRFQKSGKKHLLTNKSKRQKKAFKDGKPLTLRATRNFRRLLPYA
ncbi:MAG: bL35 family ribosomal protein [Candidatus Gracilibacteria bacterium]|jgi:large subunit ribosomal protein L35